MILSAAATHAVSAAEAIAWVVGIVIGLGALFVALGQIFKGLRGTFRWLRHAFWPWLKRAIHLVNVLADLPDRLDEMETKWDGHIRLADAKVVLLDALDERSRETAKQVALIVAEVKNNGGTSAKDSLHRIEGALGLPTPAYTPAPTGAGEPTVTPPDLED